LLNPQEEIHSSQASLFADWITSEILQLAGTATLPSLRKSEEFLRKYRTYLDMLSYIIPIPFILKTYHKDYSHPNISDGWEVWMDRKYLSLAHYL